MNVRDHLTNAIHSVKSVMAAAKSRNNDDLHPLHEEKLVEIHQSLVEILQSVHAREMLGEKIGDMEHEDRGEVDLERKDA